MKKHLFTLLAISIVIASTIQAQTIPTNGLIAWYPFTGNVVDSSGNGNTLSENIENITFSSDRFGNTNSCVYFSGAGEYLSKLSPNLPFGDSDRTISIWFKAGSFENTPGQFDIFGYGDSTSIATCSSQCSLEISPSGSCYFWGRCNDEEDTVKRNPYLWHHLVFVHKSKTRSVLYLDNKLLNTIHAGADSIILNTGSYELIVGTSIDDNGLINPFNGSLDDIRVYNRVLDSTEIAILYHEGGYPIAKSPIPTDGLVAWYPFSGNAIDSSGNGNNGIVHGATLTIDRFGNTNSAYSFNGMSWIEASSINFDTLNNLTSIAWVKTTKPDISQFILHKGCENPVNTNVSWRMYADGIYIVDSWNLDSMREYITSNINIDTNWHMVALSYDNQQIRLYIDGELNGINKQAGPLEQNNMPLYIGTKVDYSGDCNKNQFFNGSIDDIRIYNRALDSTEIQALYNEGGHILPVSIENINVAKNGNSVNINWQTATELNTSHFIIQHGTDGSSFTNIGTVKAIGSGANSYSFTDSKPANGINYYRLQSVDKDGGSSYSKVVSVQLTVDRLPFTVVPNPARDVATIKGNHIAYVQVIDNMGRVVKVVTLKDATNPSLSVSSLTKGVYHLRIQTTDGGVSGAGLVKE